MYKIVIVEDEKTICNKLGLFFEEVFLGVTLAGKFYDGKTAWNFIENNYVDIVITDIRMPGYNGLELTEKIKLCYPDIKVIVLSGYREFEYAQKAVSLGVEEYLLKPIDFDLLGDLIKKIVNKLDELKVERDKENDKIQFFSNVIYGLTNMSELKNNILTEINFSNEKLNGHIVEIEYDVAQNKEYREYEDNLAILFCNIINMYKKQSVAFTGISENNKCIIVFFGQIEDFSKEEKFLSETISETVKIRLISDFFGIDDFYDKVNNLKLIDKTDTMVAVFLEGDSEEFYKLFAEELKECSEIDFEFTKISESLVGKFNNMYSCNIEEYEYNDEFDLSENIYKLENHYKNALKKSNNRENVFIEKINIYLAENINRKVTREEIAKKIFLDPYYFSRYFKKVTGYTFSEYSMEFKIKEAIKLMRTEMPLREIAEKLGYNNYKYFVNHFKRVTTHGPSEYRNKFM